MARAVLALLLVLAGAPLRAAGGSRYYEFAADYLQALHLCQWAADMQVSGRRPLMSLALSLDEQKEKLNRAREMLGHHEGQPAPDGRRAVESLLNGIEMFSLISAQDREDLDDMNYRSELIRRLESREDERRQAVAVMAVSIRYVTDGLAGQKGLLTAQEAASLWKQATLFFGEDLAGGGASESPILAEIEELRHVLRELAGSAQPIKSP